MYRVRLQHGGKGWAYWRRCEALKKYAPGDFHVDVGQWHPCTGIDPWPDGAEYDLVLQLVPDIADVRWNAGDRTVIVGSLNVGYEHIGNRLNLLRAADHIVVNNRACWEKLGRPAGMTWISTGVDLDVFRVTVPIE
jgi:hypothetical protein